MTMQTLADSVDKFLVFNDYQILKDLGVRSKQQADQKASLTYDEFNKTQKINSKCSGMLCPLTSQVVLAFKITFLKLSHLL
jgi:hypothetical protein